MARLISRVRRHLRRYGLRATLYKAVQHLRSSVYLRETHVWYELPLGTERPSIPLPSGLTLVQGGADDLPLLDELPTTPDEEEARKRMEAGANLWFVLEVRQPAFACWIFNEAMPMLAAPNGQLVLPPKIVCLENSVTSAAYRGRGVAPAAWSNIADALELDETQFIITKIEESNIASRRAIVKSGFRESALMHFSLVGFWRRTTVQEGTGVTAGWLTKALQHKPL